MDSPFHHYLGRDYILVKLDTDACMSLPVFQRASGQSQNCVMTSKKDQKQWYGDIRSFYNVSYIRCSRKASRVWGRSQAGRMDYWMGTAYMEVRIETGTHIRYERRVLAIVRMN